MEITDEPSQTGSQSIRNNIRSDAGLCASIRPLARAGETSSSRVRTWRLCGGGVRSTRLRCRGTNSSGLSSGTAPWRRCRRSPSLLEAGRRDRCRRRDRLHRRGDSGLDSGYASQAGILLVLHNSCQNDGVLGRVPLVKRPGRSSDEDFEGTIFMAPDHAGDWVRSSAEPMLSLVCSVA